MSSAIELNTIYNEDCLKTMRRMPDGFVDLILTDPPYGIGQSNARNRKPDNRAKVGDYGEDDWDTQAPSQEVFDEIRRVSKQQIIWGGNFFTDKLPVSGCWIAWYKRPVGKTSPCELAWTSFKNGGVKYFEYLWEGYWQQDMKHKEQRVHPTQKPTALMRWCLSSYCDGPATVYDPFIGSGTTARACKDLGHTYIGSEISKKYCDIAERRLRQEILL